MPCSRHVQLEKKPTVLPARTARCTDCYNVMFADEMNRCVAGHWTCPGCLCDCDAHADLPELIPSWFRHEEEYAHDYV